MTPAQLQADTQIQRQRIANAIQRRAQNIQLGGATVGAVGSLFGGVSTLGSDERIKEDVEPGDDHVRELLEKLSAHSYRYKDEEEHGPGKRVGIMAQDLEQTEAGKSLVREIHGVKHVDVPGATGLTLAAQSYLHRRIKALEEKQEGNGGGEETDKRDEGPNQKTKELLYALTR
jgi:hypothetical protein